jgi:Tol biopolymer transport system component
MVMLLLFIGSSLRAQDVDALTVVWVSNGDLWGWREGASDPVRLAEGGIAGMSNQGANAVPIALSPDGGHVAFVKGEDLSSLWISDWHESRELVSSTHLPAEENSQPHIVDVAWRDLSTLYFNSGTSWIPRPGIVRQDDLWRVSIATGAVEQIFPPGQGGAFTFGPDGRYAALVTPGQYDQSEGKVTLFDLSTGKRLTVLSFPAVSTGSNYAFYPQIFWKSDSSGLRLAIPDKDLVYDDSSKATHLWQVSVEGLSEQIGSVNASFYGLPQWSSDGQYMAYIRRVGLSMNNQLELVLANGDGSHPTVYATGEVGTLGTPVWAEDMNRFFYEQGTPGNFWSGEPGGSPALLPVPIYSPRFLRGGRYVYATAPAGPFELRYARIGQADSTRIATVDKLLPVFAAG